MSTLRKIQSETEKDRKQTGSLEEYEVDNPSDETKVSVVASHLADKNSLGAWACGWLVQDTACAAVGHALRTSSASAWCSLSLFVVHACILSAFYKWFAIVVVGK